MMEANENKSPSRPGQLGIRGWGVFAVLVGIILFLAVSRASNQSGGTSEEGYDFRSISDIHTAAMDLRDKVSDSSLRFKQLDSHLFLGDGENIRTVCGYAMKKDETGRYREWLPFVYVVSTRQFYSPMFDSRAIVLNESTSFWQKYCG
jgi:hypothetical protein